MREHPDFAPIFPRGIPFPIPPPSVKESNFFEIMGRNRRNYCPRLNSHQVRVPQSHKPTVPQTQMIISFSRTRARRASEGHSNARKSPTVPQTQVIISFSKPIARRASKGLKRSPTQMIINRPR